MTIGLLGLGKMGSRIARKLSREGHEVFVWNRSPEPVTALIKESSNITAYPLIEELLKKLPKPKIVWLMLPAGDVTDTSLEEVLKFVDKDDIVIDGGNANYKDSERRNKKLEDLGVRFLGIGVSGGIIAEKSGYPLMVGGEKSAYEEITPLLDSLAKPSGGHHYFGTGGAGHFVKMIHNGTEYGIMQSLGEGFGVLAKSPYKLDLLEVAKLWQKGTLLSGFMLDRVVDVLTNDQTLDSVVGSIAQSGDAVGTIEQAKAEGVDVEIIERSLEYRMRSQTDPKIQISFTAKLIAALRNAFGGHAINKKTE